MCMSRPFGLFCSVLVFVMVICYILWSFGVFFLDLVYSIMENLATLVWPTYTKLLGVKFQLIDEVGKRIHLH
jgi:hypothetical protein